MTSLFSNLPKPDVEAVAQETLRRIAQRANDAPASDPAHPSRYEIDQLCFELVSDDPRAGARFIDKVVGQGVTREEIYLNYLAPAARRFGDQWDTDQTSFLQVTIGAARIFAILRALDCQSAALPTEDERHALFAAVPGENHLLGIRMAADLFRDKGWDIQVALDLSHDALLDLVAVSGHRIIGLSAASALMAPALAKLVVALRAQDPDCFILLSGQIIVDAGPLVETIMPDGIATDINTAEALMESACGR